MPERLTFSQYKLTTYLTCRRRFQLRYLKRLSWPPMPHSREMEEVLVRGQRFHRLLERHFLGLPVTREMIQDAGLRRWWSLFEKSSPLLPDGRLLPETSLTLPVGDHLLTCRFDLLVVADDEGVPFAHVFDWKTGKALSEAELKGDWQTRFYLAMLTEGGEALLENGAPLNPDHIAITYWYISDPDNPRTIKYDHSWHARNWSEIQALVEQIDSQLDDEGWPLTEDWSNCRHCAYQSYCDRQEAGSDAGALLDLETGEDVFDIQLEPELP